MSYQIEVRHNGLSKYRVVRGASRYEVTQRAEALKAQWDDEWARRLEVEGRRQDRLDQVQRRVDHKAEAAERTESATAMLSGLASILSTGLRQSTPFVWSTLKDPRTFTEPSPTPPTPQEAPIAPVEAAKTYQPRIGLLELFSSTRRSAAVHAAKTRYSQAVESWGKTVAEIDAKNALQHSEYERALGEWRQSKLEFETAKQEQHASVDAREAAAVAGQEDAFGELLDHTLDALNFPECLNVNHDLDYTGETRSCVIDFNLPSPDDLPTLKEVRFVQSREQFDEKHISEADRTRLYDSVLYQIALGVILAAFRAGAGTYLQRVVFNGWVDYVDRATGMDDRACILTVGANRSDLDSIDFERVDPKECFRALRGVAASKLIGLAPVAPLQRPRIVDRRFVQSHDVAVDAGTNIAAMAWQDFEHLVRQLFAFLFAGPGTEVSVTQASRDGGVDAVVFDPDPIKGGKIVIQAKRYTNTVGVSAVRDLFGTVHNEGASKGILVTTSNYGPDARKFADGKPLTLLDGGNLLSLLEQMGMKARIDLREAKTLLAQQD
jgi:restriction system protein